MYNDALGAERQLFTLSDRGFDLATFQLLAKRSNHQATCRPDDAGSAVCYGCQKYLYRLSVNLKINKSIKSLITL